MPAAVVAPSSCATTYAAGQRRRDASGHEKTGGDRGVEMRARFAAEHVHGDGERQAVGERDAEQAGRSADAGVLERIAAMPAKQR